MSWHFSGLVGRKVKDFEICWGQRTQHDSKFNICVICCHSWLHFLMGLTESHNSNSGPKPSSEFCTLWRALVTPWHAEVTALYLKQFKHGPLALCSAKTNPSSSPWGLASSWCGYALLWCCSKLGEAHRLTRQMVFGAGSSPRYRPSPRNNKMNNALSAFPHLSLITGTIALLLSQRIKP